MRLPPSSPYQRQVKYPGLRPRDFAIWEAFIYEYPEAFEEVWYNVKLGNPAKDEDEEHSMKCCGLYDVSQWTIDVLARRGEQYFCIEVKPDALAGALGQALAYSALLKKPEYYGIQSTPCVLTDEIAPITKEAAMALRVQLYTP